MRKNMEQSPKPLRQGIEANKHLSPTDTCLGINHRHHHRHGETKQQGIDISIRKSEKGIMDGKFLATTIQNDGSIGSKHCTIFNATSLAKSRQHMIATSQTSRVFMRSVSGLGMEDPVCVGDKKEEPALESKDISSLGWDSEQDFDGGDDKSILSTESIPDVGTIASDPTADLHTGVGFHIACLKTLCSTLCPSRLSRVAGTMKDDKQHHQERARLAYVNMDDVLRGKETARRSSFEPPKLVIRKTSSHGERGNGDSSSRHEQRDVQDLKPPGPKSAPLSLDGTDGRGDSTSNIPLWSGSTPRHMRGISIGMPLGVDQPPKMAFRVESSGSHTLADIKPCQYHKSELATEAVSPRQSSNVQNDLSNILRKFQEDQAFEALTESMPEFSMDTLPECPRNKNMTLAVELSQTRSNLSCLRRKNPRRAPALLDMAVATIESRDNIDTPKRPFLPSSKGLQCRTSNRRHTSNHETQSQSPRIGCSRDLSSPTKVVNNANDNEGLLLQGFWEQHDREIASFDFQSTAPCTTTFPRRTPPSATTTPRRASRRMCQDLPSKPPPQVCMLTTTTPVTKNVPHGCKSVESTEPSCPRSPSSVVATWTDDGESTVVVQGMETVVSVDTSTPTLSTQVSSEVDDSCHDKQHKTKQTSSPLVGGEPRWNAVATSLASPERDLPPKHCRRRPGRLWSSDTGRSTESTVSLPSRPQPWDALSSLHHSATPATTATPQQQTIRDFPAIKTIHISKSSHNRSDDSGWSTCISGGDGGGMVGPQLQSQLQLQSNSGERSSWEVACGEGGVHVVTQDMTPSSFHPM